MGALESMIRISKWMQNESPQSRRDLIIRKGLDLQKHLSLKIKNEFYVIDVIYDWRVIFFGCPGD